MSKTIDGFVIEGDKGYFLDGQSCWRKVPVSKAHIHAPDAIEAIREDFHSCRNKPSRMYQAKRNIAGETVLVTGTPLSFYAMLGDDRPFVGDCVQLAVNDAD